MKNKKEFENHESYTYEDVLKASIEYFNGDDFAAGNFANKYALNDGNGVYYELTPADMHKRLAKEFARIENKYENPLGEQEIFDLLDGFKYIVPQGSPSSAIGNPFQIQSLGNCFIVEPPFDSYGGLLKTDQELAQLMKRRAGVGFSLDNIRPKGMPTKNAAKTTDGIGVFMERFSNTCREVAQSGRRGAEIQMISVHHPEVETFINIKLDNKKITGSNVSVKLTDPFMQAVKDDTTYTQQFPVDSDEPLFKKEVRARDIWDQIIHAAWYSAEPGIFFIDNQLKNSPADIYGKVDSDFKTTATNPCGEIPMGVDSCRLLVVNLFSFVNDRFTDNAEFDHAKFSSIVRKAQRLMDDIVDLELEAIEKILEKIDSDPEPEEVKAIEVNMWKRFRRNCINGRRTGLGITGLGDTLAGLGIRYGSEESIKTTENIYKALATNAYYSSAVLAKERGAFPLYNGELEDGHVFLNRVYDAMPGLKDMVTKHGRRNIALTTTAPTGTLSTLTQTSSGIEPAFLLKYDRYKKVNPGDNNVRVDRVDDLGDSWQKYTIYHHAFKEWMSKTNKTDVEDSPYWKGTSADIDWVAGVSLQAKAQLYVDHSISRTQNIPKDSAKELVSKIYMKAWEEGCKGYTVYRDGCRDGVLVSPEDSEKEENERLIPERPKTLESKTHKIKIDFGDGEPKNSYITVSFFDGTKDPYEVFVNTQAHNLDEKDMQILELTTRNTSMSLRHGIPLQYICEQLDKIGGQYLFSIPTNIAKVLRRYLPNDIVEKDVQNDSETPGMDKCPECRERSYVLKEGCGSCFKCGFSGCS